MSDEDINSINYLLVGNKGSGKTELLDTLVKLFACRNNFRIYTQTSKINNVKSKSKVKSKKFKISEPESKKKKKIMDKVCDISPHDNKCKYNIDLSNQQLEGSDLSGQDLKNANLENTNLRNAILNNVNLEGANLTNTILDGAQIINSNLKGLDLSNMNLSNVDFRNSDLRNTNLKGTNLNGCNLTGAKIGSSNKEDILDLKIKKNLIKKMCMNLNKHYHFIKKISILKLTQDKDNDINENSVTLPSMKTLNKTLGGKTHQIHNIIVTSNYGIHKNVTFYEIPSIDYNESNYIENFEIFVNYLEGLNVNFHGIIYTYDASKCRVYGNHKNILYLLVSYFGINIIPNLKIVLTNCDRINPEEDNFNIENCENLEEEIEELKDQIEMTKNFYQNRSDSIESYFKNILNPLLNNEDIRNNPNNHKILIKQHSKNLLKNIMIIKVGKIIYKRNKDNNIIFQINSCPRYNKSFIKLCGERNINLQLNTLWPVELENAILHRNEYNIGLNFAWNSEQIEKIKLIEKKKMDEHKLMSIALYMAKIYTRNNQFKKSFVNIIDKISNATIIISQLSSLYHRTKIHLENNNLTKDQICSSIAQQQNLSNSHQYIYEQFEDARILLESIKRSIPFECHRQPVHEFINEVQFQRSLLNEDSLNDGKYDHILTKIDSIK